MAGSTPAVAQEAMRASGVRPRFLASSAVISTMAARAVVDARGVAGGDRAFLGEGRAQLLQSFERRAGLDVLVLIDDDVALAGERSVTGTISSLNLPAFWAASALFCEASANRSCSSRLICHLAATFSAVLPM